MSESGWLASCRGAFGSRGYTLIELLIALLLTSILITSSFSTFQAVQLWWQNFEQMVSRDENLRTAPVLLVRWLTPAGSNRHGYSWTGVALDEKLLEVKSDFDGEAGFPDGQLTESFEKVAIRLKNNELQIRSGNGSFQPFLKQVTRFEPVSESSSELLIHLEGTTAARLAGSGEDLTESLVIRTWLPNYVDNLFPEKLP